MNLTTGGFLMWDAADIWDDTSPDWHEMIGPELTDEMIRSAEAGLGYKLPDSYLSLLRTQNGGLPKRCCFPTPVPTSWARDHVRITGLHGIGGWLGIDNPQHGSRYMIREWGYPDVGVVIAYTPSAGHDTIMLDYSECGPRGEPRVIHVETECAEPRVLVLAPDFGSFVRGLVSCDRFGGDA
jgi:hypothetical protein